MKIDELLDVATVALASGSVKTLIARVNPPVKSVSKTC